MKDHEIRELVDDLTRIAREYGQTQQLRARIAGKIIPVLEQPLYKAAPDLLEACERLLGWSFWESGGNAERDAQFARAAIAKAKGEA